MVMVLGWVVVWCHRGEILCRATLVIPNTPVSHLPHPHPHPSCVCVLPATHLSHLPSTTRQTRESTIAGKGPAGSHRSMSVYEKPKRVTFVSPLTGTNKRPSPRHWSQEADENDDSAMPTITGSATEDAAVMGGGSGSGGGGGGGGGSGSCFGGATASEREEEESGDGARRVNNTPRIPTKKKVKMLG